MLPKPDSPGLLRLSVKQQYGITPPQHSSDGLEQQSCIGLHQPTTELLLYGEVEALLDVHYAQYSVPLVSSLIRYQRCLLSAPYGVPPCH